MEVTQPLVACAAMLIRRPPLDCYEAFVDPAITSKFWFTDGSDRLDAGRQVTWTWASVMLLSPKWIQVACPLA